MRVRALDSTGDFSFGKGKNNYLKDLDALKQNISTRIKMWKGECFFALTEGVDWNNWFEINTKSFLDLDLRRRILQTNGVIRISEYESEISSSNREISIESTIVTVYGTTAVVF